MTMLTSTLTLVVAADADADEISSPFTEKNEQKWFRAATGFERRRRVRSIGRPIQVDHWQQLAPPRPVSLQLSN